MASPTQTLSSHVWQRAYLTFVPLGLVFWLIFLIFVRLVGPTVFSHGNPALLAQYVVSIPILVGLIRLLAALTHTQLSEMLVPITIICLTALLLDGLAVGFTDFYGPTLDQVSAAAASLLWGVGITFLGTLWLVSRSRHS